MKKVYLAGGMLTKAEQMLRASEREDIKKIGLDMYVPQDNKEINDKANVNNEGLAERIVKADTEAIIESDIMVVEYQPHYLGTIVEIGQMKGMKDLAKMILDIAEKEDSCQEMLSKIIALAEKINNKKVFPHCEDIRRFKGAGKDEIEDRRSFSVNAYVYGTILDLTDGKGFYEWSEILEELEKIKNNECQY